MKKLALMAVILASCCAAAQDYPRYELSASYAYGTVNTQGYGNQNNAQGWNGSLTRNFLRWMGLETAVGGQYNTELFTVQGNTLTANSQYYNFMAGPRFVYRKGKLAPFVHTLFGVQHDLSFGSASYDAGSGTATIPYDNAFGAAFGGGIDYILSRHWSFRSQGDYFYTRETAANATMPSNYRVLAGIVFAFGGKSDDLDAKRKKQAPVVASTSSSSPEPTPTLSPARSETETAEQAAAVSSSSSEADSEEPADTASTSTMAAANTTQTDAEPHPLTRTVVIPAPEKEATFPAGKALPTTPPPPPPVQPAIAPAPVVAAQPVPAQPTVAVAQPTRANSQPQPAAAPTVTASSQPAISTPAVATTPKPAASQPMAIVASTPTQAEQPKPQADVVATSKPVEAPPQPLMTAPATNGVIASAVAAQPAMPIASATTQVAPKPARQPEVAKVTAAPVTPAPAPAVVTAKATPITPALAQSTNSVAVSSTNLSGSNLMQNTVIINDPNNALQGEIQQQQQPQQESLGDIARRYREQKQKTEGN